MRARCTHYQGQCDRLVCPLELTPEEEAEAYYATRLRERAQEEPTERVRLEVDARDLKW